VLYVHVCAAALVTEQVIVSGGVGSVRGECCKSFFLMAWGALQPPCHHPGVSAGF